MVSISLATEFTNITSWYS